VSPYIPPPKSEQPSVPHEMPRKNTSEKQLLHLQRARQAKKLKQIKKMADEELMHEEQHKTLERLEKLEKTLKTLVKRKQPPISPEEVKEDDALAKRPRTTESDGPSRAAHTGWGGILEYLAAGIAAACVIGVGVSAFQPGSRKRTTGDGEHFIPLC
jgi:hypothetical protein